MRNIIISFISGTLFAVGLAISGMTKPSKVIQFLDFLGDWDPSLAFVMIGAIFITFIGFQLILPRMNKPLFARKFILPTSLKIDSPMIIGSALFGIGWGLSGFCPGPSIASLVTGYKEVLVFVAFMLVGLLLGGFIQRLIPESVYRN
ncbi:MAG TPA: YeeE/YedE family protein [Aeromonadales bacterium]|nr:YeeE/YedE family protein [Aeromonadales bacterium]